MNAPLRSPIVYAGGKRAIISHLLPMVPVHDAYTETFFGGGELFFAKDPAKNETINDLLDVVINFYTVLKMNYAPLKKLIDSTLISQTMFADARATIQAHNKKKRVNKVKLAWAFWMCSTFAFGRSIRSTAYTYSNNKCVSTPLTLKNKKDEFTEFLVKRIESVYIECRTAIDVLRSRDGANFFHYLDPPYFFGNENKPAFHAHYKNIFSIDDYHQILIWCASECKGKFMLSNYNCALLEQYIREFGWYKKEIIHRLQAPRKTGIEKIEVVVTNYSTPCGTLKLF